MLADFRLDRRRIEFQGKTIFLEFNHRCSILCWFDVVPDRDNILITLDLHHDFLNLLPESAARVDIWNKTRERSKLERVVKCLAPLSDDFIQAAFRLGIISQAIIITPREYDEVAQVDEGIFKKITLRKRIDDLLSILRDHNFLYVIEGKNLILDIDLDFFTGDHDNPWSRSDKKLRLEEFQRGAFLNTVPLLFKNKVEPLTIALEPVCCGGISNSITILRSLLNGIGLPSREISRSIDWVNETFDDIQKNNGFEDWKRDCDE